MLAEYGTWIEIKGLYCGSQYVWKSVILIAVTPQRVVFCQFTFTYTGNCVLEDRLNIPGLSMGIFAVYTVSVKWKIKVPHTQGQATAQGQSLVSIPVITPKFWNGAAFCTLFLQENCNRQTTDNNIIRFIISSIRRKKTSNRCLRMKLTAKTVNTPSVPASCWQPQSSFCR